MTTDNLLAAFGIRGVLLGLGLYKLGRALSEYRTRRDPRALIGFVDAIAILGGIFALTFASPAIRFWAGPQLDQVFRILTGTAVGIFITGLVFSSIAPWLARRFHREAT